MNRNQEYLDWMQALDQTTPDVRPSLKKARRRSARLTFVYRPLASAAALLAVFVLLVNFSAPAARAFAQVPILKDLAAAVTFSRSLTDAVEHDYVQTLDLTETQNHITATIAHLIVDQRQVNIFYTLNSDPYEQLEADPTVLTAEGNRPESCMYSSRAFGTPNGELRTLTIDFGENDVPEALRVQLNVYNNAPADADGTLRQNARDGELPERQKTYLAQFDFLVTFDAQRLAAGEILSVHHTMELDGQSVTITQVEVYPTHIQVKVKEDPNNTAWLTGLDFRVETDQGMSFEPVSNGVIATGADSTPAMVTYRADSPYFHEAKGLKLVVTGAQWLRKDMERTRLYLLTGETDALPAGTAFESAAKSGSDWVVAFTADQMAGKPMYPVFRNAYYDADGNAYEIDAWSYTSGEASENGDPARFVNQFTLRGYPYDEVWLCPQFSHRWIADGEIIVTVK